MIFNDNLFHQEYFSLAFYWFAVFMEQLVWMSCFKLKPDIRQCDTD